MPRLRKRKQPIARVADVSPTSSTSAQSCRTVIRQFHVLLKKKRQLEQQIATGGVSPTAVSEIDMQIKELGGLEHYQQLSVLGQSQDRGGGSEKVFIKWLKELEMHKSAAKLRLLEVGALRHDNFRLCSSWIDCHPMDLHSRHPSIREQDFLQLNPEDNNLKWDLISLSLVVNFVPEPFDRGRMLKLAYDFLKPNGRLFFALPLPCVANSRYVDFDYLRNLMLTLGFHQEQERWKAGGKMAYWLYRKGEPQMKRGKFHKKVVLRTGQRNNFAILLGS